MIKLPLETFKLYQSRLAALGISSHQTPHYVKWVRYFLDFEAKYGNGQPTPGNTEGVSPGNTEGVSPRNLTRIS